MNPNELAGALIGLAAAAGLVRMLILTEQEPGLKRAILRAMSAGVTGLTVLVIVLVADRALLWLGW